MSFYEGDGRKPDKEAKKPVYIQLPLPLWLAFRKECAMRGVSMNQMASHFIAKGMDTLPKFRADEPAEEGEA